MESAAETITCPACKRTLQVPASYFGQTVQCPECRHQFEAKADATAVQSSKPRPAAPPPEPEPEPEPRRRRDDEDDDYGDVDMPRIRHSSIPHRGGMILAMGLIALVLFPYATPICGPIAWIMGNSDLAAIRAGRMDPTGEGMVQAGRILGIIGTALAVVTFGLVCLMIGFIFWVG